MNSRVKQPPIPNNNALALDRTVLANERTYQAWIRTGLSIFVTGLGVAKFLKGEMPLARIFHQKERQNPCNPI